MHFTIDICEEEKGNGKKGEGGKEEVDTSEQEEININKHISKPMSSLKFNNISLNSAHIPDEYTIAETHDFSEKQNTEEMKFFDICRTGSYKDKYGNINKFTQEKRDIILESCEDIKLRLGGQSALCKKGKHFFPGCLFIWHNFNIVKDQKYTVYVLENNNEVRKELNEVIKMILMNNLLYIEGLSGKNDTEKYIGFMAGCFGGIPRKFHDVEINYNKLFSEYKYNYLSHQEEISNPDRSTLTYKIKIQHIDLHEILSEYNHLCAQSSWEFLTKIPSTFISVKENDFDELSSLLLEEHSIQITRPFSQPQYKNKTDEKIKEDTENLSAKIIHLMNMITEFTKIGYIYTEEYTDIDKFSQLRI